MLKIPLYAIRHKKIGGTEFAIYNLIRGLAAAGINLSIEYGRDSDLSEEFLDWITSQPGIISAATGGLPGPKGARFLEELLYQQRRNDDGWALFPNYFLPPSLLGRRGKSAVILHDIQYKQYPEFHSTKRRRWLDFYLPRMLQAADKVILISQSEQDLVRKFFGQSAADKCSIVYNAIEFERFSNEASSISPAVTDIAQKEYIISVCHQFPHKNIPTILKAFEKIAYTKKNIDLCLVGSSSPSNASFIRNHVSEEVRERIHLTGFVSDAELGLLYRNARLFVLPSLYEGFGMPAVEALGLGVPTLVSNAFALPEVTMGYAGLIDDPLDVGAWADAMNAELSSGKRPSDQQIAHIRAAYSPISSAQSLLSVLQEQNPSG